MPKPPPYLPLIAGLLAYVALITGLTLTGSNGAMVVAWALWAFASFIAGIVSIDHDDAPHPGWIPVLALLPATHTLIVTSLGL